MKFSCLDLFDKISTYLNLGRKKKKNDNKNSKNKKEIEFGNFGGLSNDGVLLLVERLVAWYHIKFPDNDLKIHNGKVSVVNFSFRVNNFEVMTRNDLFNRLAVGEKEAFLCKYKSDFELIFNENSFDLNKMVNTREKIIVCLKSKRHFLNRNSCDKCIVVADENGKIEQLFGSDFFSEFDFNKYTGDTLESLLYYLEDSDFDDINYNSLSKCVNERFRDLAVRKKVINYVALRLVFDSDNYEYGYFRAQEFLKDFNDYYSLGLRDDYLYNLVSHYKKRDGGKNNKKENGKDMSLKKKKTTV